MKRTRTKIVATIGRNNDVDFIRCLFDAGACTFRLNTAHQEPEDSARIIQNIRTVSEKAAILVDTKGPEIRTVGIDSPLSVEEGDEVFIVPEGANAPGKSFSVTYPAFCRVMATGIDVLIDDGDLSLTINDIDGEILRCRVNNDGSISNRKSINVPDIPIALPPLTEKDKQYIRFAAEQNLDFIAHSFVRNREDVLAVQAILDEYRSPIKIISKIENKEGIRNLDEILDHCHGVMIARGDLGIELPAEEVPIAQKKMIRKCIKRRKVVITATQMLHSMIDNPRPTRAEVSDVANAVMDGTDALMLSGETAYGDYALEAVQTMAAIAKKSESQFKPVVKESKVVKISAVRYQLIKAAVDIARSLKTKAIVVQTDSGRSARLLAAYRGKIPVMALSPDPTVMRQLALSFGVYAYPLNSQETLDDMVSESVRTLLEASVIKDSDMVVMVGSSPMVSQVTNFLEVGEAARFLGGRE